MLRVAIISNELPPYRVPLFQHLAALPGIAFRVFFCCRREPNRLWDLPEPDFDHEFLTERIVEKKGRYIHNNPDVFRALARFGPDIVVTGGFNPTHLYGLLFALCNRLPHVAMTDGTLQSERGLGRMHRAVRRFVYARSAAFVYAGDGGRELYQSYGIDPERCFKACLCIDNAAFAPPQEVRKRFDFLFCGRFEAVKNPEFAFAVAREAARRLGRKTSMLFVGAGSLEPQLRRLAAGCPDLVGTEFRPFTSHAELPALYHASRVFLFPTEWDPWGVVLNEACAAGLPGIVSPHSGAARELVRDGENGFVCPLELETWTERALRLLQDPALVGRQGEAGIRRVARYSYANAAQGIALACRAAQRSFARTARCVDPA